MTNLNIKFNGRMNLTDDVVCYVDESGDEGFDFTKNCTKWFVVAGTVSTYQTANEMLKTITDFRDKYCAQKQIHRLSHKELTHLNRRNIYAMLRSHPYLGTASVFYKPQIDPTDRMCTYPSMYFIGIKNIIERATWLAQQHNKNRVHILISNRNSISTTALQKYLFDTSIAAGANLYYPNRLGVVALSTPTNHHKLLLGDYTASALFQYLEKTGEANMAEEVYANLLLKGKMYASSHPRYKGVWGNGLKCTPTDIGLIENSGILEEGSHKL